MPTINFAADASDQKLVPLSTLRDGERGRVHSRDMRCDDCALLNAMGLTDQCEIRMCQAGEPCIVQVRTTRLGIARSLAGKIMISVTVGRTDSPNAKESNHR